MTISFPWCIMSNDKGEAGCQGKLIQFRIAWHLLNNIVRHEQNGNHIADDIIQQISWK